MQRYSEFVLVYLIHTLGIPARRELQESILDRTKAQTSVLVASTNRLWRIVLILQSSKYAILQIFKTCCLKDIFLVENDPEASKRWRKGNIDVIDQHTVNERRMVVKQFRRGEHEFRFVIIEL